MQLIYTDEAKALLDECYPAVYSKVERPTLRKFLHDGSSAVFSCAPNERSTAVSHYTSAVDAAHNKVLHLLRPYLFVSNTGLFEGLSPVGAYNEEMNFWRGLLIAVDLVTDFDILVGLTYLYPNQCETPADEIRQKAYAITAKPLAKTRKASRLINSGRPFEQG